MKTLTTNKITATGRVVKIKEFKDYAEVVLLIDEERKFFPNFRIEKSLVNTFSYRDMINISGHVETFSVKSNDKTVRYQRFIADEVKKAKTLIEEEFNIKGTFFANSHIDALFEGYIESILDEGDYLRIFLSNNDKPIKISAKKSNKLPEINSGDTVCCVCKITTRIKVFDNKTKYFEDILVSDIAKS